MPWQWSPWAWVTITPSRRSDLGREQLLAKVRSAIDEHSLAGAFDQDRGAQAWIARLVGIALAPVVPDLRHAGRRPAAENPDLHAGFLEQFEEVGGRCFGELLGLLAPQLGDEACRVGDERRLALLAAMRDRREERRIRLDQHLVGRAAIWPSPAGPGRS